MCLSTVYENILSNDSIVMKNVSNVSIENNTITLVDLMERKMILNGTIDKVDLMENYIIIKTEDKK